MFHQNAKDETKKEKFWRQTRPSEKILAAAESRDLPNLPNLPDLPKIGQRLSFVWPQLNFLIGHEKTFFQAIVFETKRALKDVCTDVNELSL